MHTVRHFTVFIPNLSARCDSGVIYTRQANLKYTPLKIAHSRVLCYKGVNNNPLSVVAFQEQVFIKTLRCTWRCVFPVLLNRQEYTASLILINYYYYYSSQEIKVSHFFFQFSYNGTHTRNLFHGS